MPPTFDPNDPLLVLARNMLRVRDEQLVSAVIRGLDSKDQDTQRISIYAASALGLEAAQAVPKLVALLDDPGCPDPHRVLAVMALHRLGPIAHAAGPTLLTKMRNARDRTWRIYMSWLHWRVTGQAEPALEIWAKAIDQGGLDTVCVAVNHLGPAARAAMPLFEQWLATASRDGASLTGVALALNAMVGREEGTSVLAKYVRESVALATFEQLYKQRDDD